MWLWTLDIRNTAQLFTHDWLPLLHPYKLITNNSWITYLAPFLWTTAVVIWNRNFWGTWWMMSAKKGIDCYDLSIYWHIFWVFKIISRTLKSNQICRRKWTKNEEKAMFNLPFKDPLVAKFEIIWLILKTMWTSCFFYQTLPSSTFVFQNWSWHIAQQRFIFMASIIKTS